MKVAMLEFFICLTRELSFAAIVAIETTNTQKSANDECFRIGNEKTKYERKLKERQR